VLIYSPSPLSPSHMLQVLIYSPSPLSPSHMLQVLIYSESKQTLNNLGDARQ